MIRLRTATSIMLPLVAGVAFLWSLSAGAEARSSHDREAAALAECNRLAEQISSNAATTRLGADAIEDDDILRIVETTANATGIDDRQIVRVWPMPARPIPDSDLALRPIEIEMTETTLAQLLGVLREIRASEPGVVVQELALTAAESDRAGERWDWRATLAYVLADTEDQASHQR